jgi:hypothetical protein
VTGIVYLDRLDEFLLPVLEVEGPDDMLFQQEGGLHISTDFLNRKFQRNGLAMAAFNLATSFA